jgi:hypothetical protein
MQLSCSNFSASRWLLISIELIWWLELDVAPVTIDGPTTGDIEFSHKSYNPALAVLVAVNPAEVNFAGYFIESLMFLIVLCVALTLSVALKLPVMSFLVALCLLHQTLYKQTAQI